MFDGDWRTDDDQVEDSRIVLEAWIDELLAGRNPVVTLHWLIA